MQLKNTKFDSKRLLKGVLLSVIAVALSGCNTLQPNSSKSLQGPSITENKTVVSDSMTCAVERIRESKGSFSRKPRVAVDQIPDLTGKISQLEGAKVSQGVDHMAVTALTKFRQSIDIVERNALSSFNFENEMTRRQLVGDGKRRKIAGTDTVISFKPLYKGRIYGADYFITGAVTEANFNIYSGGSALGISGFDFGRKKVVMNIGIDLRIVNMHNLKVEDSITLEKQFIGERVGGDILRFSGSELISFDSGYSRDEPIQRGVRALIQQGISSLLGEVMGANVGTCFNVSLDNKVTDKIN